MPKLNSDANIEIVTSVSTGNTTFFMRFGFSESKPGERCKTSAKILNIVRPANT